MKNITVSVSDDVYRDARIRAAHEGTSVSALVADFLRSLSAQDAEFERLQTQQFEVIDRIRARGGFRAADRLDRDALHDRDLARAEAADEVR